MELLKKKKKNLEQHKKLIFICLRSNFMPGKLLSRWPPQKEENPSH